MSLWCVQVVPDPALCRFYFNGGRDMPCRRPHGSQPVADLLLGKPAGQLHAEGHQLSPPANRLDPACRHDDAENGETAHSQNRQQQHPILSVGNLTSLSLVVSCISRLPIRLRCITQWGAVRPPVSALTFDIRIVRTPRLVMR